jgi:hypothetical protein
LRNNFGNIQENCGHAKNLGAAEKFLEGLSKSNSSVLTVVVFWAARNTRPEISINFRRSVNVNSPGNTPEWAVMIISKSKVLQATAILLQFPAIGRADQILLTWTGATFFDAVDNAQLPFLTEQLASQPVLADRNLSHFFRPTSDNSSTAK